MRTTTIETGLGSPSFAMRPGALLVAALIPLFLVGCTADATLSATTPENASPQIREESGLSLVGTKLTSTVSTVGQAAGACAPLTCCFPTGSEWGNNTFENALKALGCATPSAYTERYGSTDWWMFSQCKVTPALLTLVADYSTAAPYYSSIAVNECLLLDSTTALEVNTVFVQFDPTCSSCRPAR